MITCSFCSHQFKEQQTEHSCKGCPMSGACKMIRCPYCGYEMPPEPKWIGKLKKLFTGKDKHRSMI